MSNPPKVKGGGKDSWQTIRREDKRKRPEGKPEEVKRDRLGVPLNPAFAELDRAAAQDSAQVRPLTSTPLVLSLAQPCAKAAEGSNVATGNLRHVLPCEKCRAYAGGGEGASSSCHGPISRYWDMAWGWMQLCVR